jgi:hypothetical protein
VESSKFRPPENTRTFETRVKFIDEIFSAPYTPDQIMASCIKYKLNKSFDEYIKDIHKSLWNLRGKDPMAVLKRIDS